ncbi:MAG TPA: glycolate oxidase subunit GlcF [Candidatus Competibacteraceae bacterium]|nr:glycolate oxidase subunit GlcF [Candidatus Competibacteraceae bacterium]
MQTQLADFIKDTPEGHEADQILRTCVHCGFCNATCPTYQLLGNELDGPRGRIYLVKQLLEGHEVSAKTQLHLDRCLTCRACESTCPSGVTYHRLADIGRHLVEERVQRPLPERLLRWGLRQVLPYRARFTPLLRLGQALRPLLPAALKAKVPAAAAAGRWPAARHARRVLLLEGCVQPALAPDINAATARVLDRLGVSVERVAAAGCCGAVSYHLNAQEEGLDFMRRLIDAWWPAIESGVEAIIVNISGCGVTVKEYGHLLHADPAYAEKAARVSAMTRDIGEFLAQEAGLQGRQVGRGRRLAFHSPCTLQHGQKLDGVVEGLLSGLGFQLTPVHDAHLCCGSTGTYSILQPELSLTLRDNKLKNLEAGDPELIATANIGCLTHLAGGTRRPVRHWIEVLDQALA